MLWNDLREYLQRLDDNLIINACRPFTWIEDFPTVNVNGPELRARILDRWKDLFE